jgi:hypothetical protein
MHLYNYAVMHALDAAQDMQTAADRHMGLIGREDDLSVSDIQQSLYFSGAIVGETG